ncbi:MAG: hypothetical protein MUP16_04500 [Sedimentisphaerales bacterium]|nr:hypothetical protein [Sedimentisphaerales bacterium]
MFKKTLFLTTVLSVLLACNLQAEQIHSTWVGGPSGQWEENDNWDPFEFMSEGPDNITGLPGHSYVVTINKPPINIDEVTVGLYYSHTIDSLDCYGKVNLENWSDHYVCLSIPESNPPYPPDVNCLTNHGDLSIEIDIRGDVTNITGATLELGEHINIFGDLYNEVGGTITVYMTDIDIEEGGEVYNDGLIRIYTVGGIGETPYFHNNGEIQLFIGGGCNGAIFDNNCKAVIQGSGAVTGQQLHNKGTIRASMGPLLLYFEGSLTNSGILKNDVGATLNVHIPIDANNEGTIETNAGGAMTFDCNLCNEPNGIIKLLGGTLAATTITQKADANFAGFGGITGNVIIDSNGIIKLTGPTNIVGDVNISPNATLEVSDGTTLITGQTTCNGTIHIKGGYIIPQGGLSGNCNVIWEPGLYTNVADFNLDGQVNLKDFAYFANTWLWQTAWR